MVHWTCEELAPPRLAREIFNERVPPGFEFPELMETVSCCARAQLAATPSINHRKPNALGIWNKSV